MEKGSDLKNKNRCNLLLTNNSTLQYSITPCGSPPKKSLSFPAVSGRIDFSKQTKTKGSTAMKYLKPWKISLMLGLVLMLFLYDSQPALSMPQMDFTIYGSARVGDKTLTRSDTDYVLTLEVNGRELVRYVMGSLPSFQDYYVLKVPMDSDPFVQDKAYMGDTAHIFVNGKPVSENPIIVGNPGETILLDISAP
jgi:hypothetical protein